MTATDTQVRIIMRERQKGRTQEQAAASANLRSRKTVAKYEQLGQLPSERQLPRQYRTRTDAFAEEWLALKSTSSRFIANAGDQVPPGAVETRIERLRQIVESSGGY